MVITICMVAALITFVFPTTLTMARTTAAGRALQYTVPSTNQGTSWDLSKALQTTMLLALFVTSPHVVRS